MKPFLQDLIFTIWAAKGIHVTSPIDPLRLEDKLISLIYQTSTVPAIISFFKYLKYSPGNNLTLRNSDRNNDPENWAQLLFQEIFT